MLKTTILNDLLKKLLMEVKDLTAVLVIDAEGLIIAQQSVESFDEEIIGAIMSVLEKTISKIRKFAETSHGSGTFDTNEYRLFYQELGSSVNALFVLVANQYANMDEITPFSYIVAEKISLILSGLETSPDIPSLRENGELEFPYQKISKSGKNLENHILMIGDDMVGKTSLINMYAKGEYAEKYKPTIGLSIIEKELQITNRLRIIFNLFDMGGGKSFAKVRKYYYKYSNAKMIAVLFDYSRNGTLENVNNWLKEARQFVNNFNSIQCILIGNKIDLSEDRFQMKKTAEVLAKENNLRFFETSALTGEGIDELFMFISNYEY